MVGIEIILAGRGRGFFWVRQCVLGRRCVYPCLDAGTGDLVSAWRREQEQRHTCRRDDRRRRNTQGQTQ